MTLLMSSVDTYQEDQDTVVANKIEKDELSLVMHQTIKHPSPMSATLKHEKRASKESLENLLKKVIQDKGDAVHINQLGDKEFEIEGLSSMTLHSFILKAEELGKNVSFKKSIKVQITD